MAKYNKMGVRAPSSRTLISSTHNDLGMYLPPAQPAKFVQPDAGTKFVDYRALMHADHKLCPLSCTYPVR